jgi:hypothetical protein
LAAEDNTVSHACFGNAFAINTNALGRKIRERPTPKKVWVFQKYLFYAF